MKNMAAEIGSLLREKPKLLMQPFVDTVYGKLSYIKKPITRTDIPRDHINKKALFWLGDKYVLCHFWGEEYVGDPTYFKKLYEDSKRVLLDRNVPTPKLISFDDKTLTWVTERMVGDLSQYLMSKDTEAIDKVLDRIILLFKNTWQKTKSDRISFPRYVRSFLEPEYGFLKTKLIEDYLSGSIVTLYKRTLKELSQYLEGVKKMGFESGLGFADVKLDNLVEDNRGDIFFIDADKPEYVHWATMFGQVYQDVIKKGGNDTFENVIDKKRERIVGEDKMNKYHINIGRMNRCLLPCTLRNISFNHEIGGVTDEAMIETNLLEVSNLIKDFPYRQLSY
jgi:hypothetical protein